MRSRGRCSGQRTARRSAPFERRHHDLLARRRGCDLRRRLGLRSIRLQIGELKLELIEQRTTLRGLAEPIVPQLPDRELELLDQQRPVLGLALRRCAPYLGRTQRLALRDDERMRTRKSSGSESSMRHATMKSQSRCICERQAIDAVIHNAAINPPPAVARSVAASASRCLRANSRAAPARSSPRRPPATAR